MMEENDKNNFGIRLQICNVLPVKLSSLRGPGILWNPCSSCFL